MRLVTLLTIGLCLVAASAFGQAAREFNWLPSGTIDVGNLESENGSNYRSVGDIIQADLAYRDGVRPDARGRRTTEEIFTVTIARWRAGASMGALVIRRRIDTGAEPVELTILIDGEEKGKWLHDKLDGDRRFADVFFVIPASAMPRNRDNPDVLRDPISVRIKAAQPYDSFGYTFYITRDWDLLPENYGGRIPSQVPSTGEFLPLAGYLFGLGREGDHAWDEAIEHYRTAEKVADSELARCIRRKIRLCEYAKAASAVKDAPEKRGFDVHYALGQYCASNGFWYEALDEYTKAVEANPASGDATYNMAEAMEYCYLPIAEWAPLMGRAGMLYNRPDVNETTILAAINMYELPDGPDKRVKAPLPKSDMDALYRDWTYVEQIVYGTTRGAWHMRKIGRAHV